MDISTSLAPRSDQINADDLVAGPMTVTIRKVVGGKAEQPFDFLLEETDRAFRPAVTMRRLIAAAWGTDGDQYVGRRLTLYRDPTIRFGKDVVGGIRISHMSHIDKRIEIKLQVTRGKRDTFAVDPLPTPAPVDPRIAALKAEWATADADRRKVIEDEVATIKAGA
ncbi:hypothetical protein GCM10011584_09690 [Nocardioides phosphati]|uniref:Single-stranded DNA-binding protein n=1 Tax=Nocardioides phosphati TaxID=1867775 RepID=A0ABQ2N7Y8_9ACTN|nr:hypothetical protein [Nocardioides phosphati]GGO86710.1 hypothetical protein GCM10011584_09690 [Nocardioides phosphati]